MIFNIEEGKKTGRFGARSVLIAELPLAKRSSAASWVRKLCNPSNPSSREKFGDDVTYERTSFVRPSVRPSVCPDRIWGREGESRGSPNGEAEESHPFRCLKRKGKLISVCCQQTIAEVDLTF